MKIGNVRVVVVLLMGVAIKLAAYEVASLGSFAHSDGSFVNSDGEVEQNHGSWSESDQKLIDTMKARHEQVLNAKKREHKINMINLAKETEGNPNAGLALSQFSAGQAHELLQLKLSQDAELEKLENELKTQRAMKNSQVAIKNNSDASIVTMPKRLSADNLLQRIGDLNKQLYDKNGMPEKSQQIARSIDGAMADYAQSRLVQQDVRGLLRDRNLTIDNFTRETAEKLELRLINKYNNNPVLVDKLKSLVLNLIVISEQYRASEVAYHQDADEIYQQWNGLLGIVR